MQTGILFSNDNTSNIIEFRSGSSSNEASSWIVFEKFMLFSYHQPKKRNKKKILEPAVDIVFPTLEKWIKYVIMKE